MAAKFILKQSGKNFRFTLQAPNGQVILTSESYSSKDAALRGINSIRKSAGKDSNFEVRAGKSGTSYFLLKAGNREVIGKSQVYTDERNIPKGRASVQTNAPDARVEDLTVRK